MKAFFKKTIRVNITPTTARMVMEITMKRGVDANVIGEGERKSCLRTSGHNEMTVNKFYSYYDRYFILDIFLPYTHVICIHIVDLLMLSVQP